MNDNIKLPPLPKPAYADLEGCVMFSSVQMTDYARAAVEADRQRRGEPVTILHDDGHYTYKGIKPEGYDRAGWRMEVYAAPQPAEPSICDGKTRELRHDVTGGPLDFSEPVKVPSDEELLKWGEEEEFFLFCDEDGFLQIVREALSRYGQPAASAEPVAEVTHCKPDNYSANHRIKWLTQQEFPVGTKLYAAPVAAQPSVPKGWKWLKHPTRFDGQPIPVRFFTDHDEEYYQPFDENGTDFAVEDMDDEWVEVPTPPAEGQAQQDADKVDAERYRWIAAHYVAIHHNWIDGIYTIELHAHPKLSSPEKLRTAIDAARKEQPFDSGAQTPAKSLEPRMDTGNRGGAQTDNRDIVTTHKEQPS